jgi:hypothetical protein
MAQSGLEEIGEGCPLSEVKRTSEIEAAMSACDPKRSFHGSSKVGVNATIAGAVQSENST